VSIGSDGSGDRVGRVDTVGLVGFAQSNNPINPTKNLTPKTSHKQPATKHKIMQQKIKEKIKTQPQHKHD
jgi:hypothetical protein